MSLVVVVGCAPATVTDPKAVPLEWDRGGGRPEFDDSLLEAVSGAAVPGDDLVRAATCHNAVRWTKDISLNTYLVLSTNPSLVRVAELVDGGEIDVETAESMQRAVLDGRDVADVEFGSVPGEAERLADLVRTPPGEEALERFVVYVSSETTRRQGVVTLDIRKLAIENASSATRYQQDFELLIAGLGEFSFEASECARFERTAT